MIRANLTHKSAAGLVAITALAVSGAAAPGTAHAVADAAAPLPPTLRLTAVSPSVTLDRVQVAPGVTFSPTLNLGTYMVADKAPFEVRVNRSSYADPIVATWVVGQGARALTKPLPAGLVRDFSGLSDFFHVTFSNASGATVLDRDDAFCPNAGAIRASPAAFAASSFPAACATNPFALGAAWGIPAGWGTATGSADSDPVDLPAGTYTATITVNQPYRALFDVQGSSQTVHVTIETVSQSPLPSAQSQAASTNIAPPDATQLTASSQVPNALKPDLRPLPAWGITISRSGGRDYLDFSAAVWNAGPGALVVQGFRRPGTELMDAYQYFQNPAGGQAGYSEIGTLNWDPDPGHQHWHFTDFAGYSLLDSAQKQVVRSTKDGFCLVNTDAIDTLVDNATPAPLNTSLRSDCGGLSALSVTEALAVGWGDTYVQALPGQSFDITDLPDGTYYVQIAANPDGNLAESDRGNDVSLRKVVIGGTPGARTVTVPPYQLVTAP